MPRFDPALQKQALKLGFYPVEIDFPKQYWEEGFEIESPLWLRHVPEVGDEILFCTTDESYFRGRVVKRVFYAQPGSELFDADYGDDMLSSIAVLYLGLDPVIPSNAPESDDPVIEFPPAGEGE